MGFFFSGCDSTHYGTDCSLACSINCTGNICNKKGYCTDGCKMGTYGDMCQKQCSTCNANCDRITGQCIGECPTGKFGTYCEEMCDQLCSNGCMKSNGVCNSCDDKKYGDYCNKTCSPQCQSACDQQSGSCECLSGWTGTACNGRYTKHFCVLTRDYVKEISCFRLTQNIMLMFPVTPFYTHPSFMMIILSISVIF